MVNFKWDDKRALEVAKEEGKKAAKEARAEGVQETRRDVALDMLKNNLAMV